MNAIGYTESIVRLETNGTEHRLHVDYAIVGLDDFRKKLLLRRTLSIIAGEEKRIYSLPDSQVLAELDALTAMDAKNSIQFIEKP